MPKGVEHTAKQADTLWWLLVIHSKMPKGVEHIPLIEIGSNPSA